MDTAPSTNGSNGPDPDGTFAKGNSVETVTGKECLPRRNLNPGPTPLSVGNLKLTRLSARGVLTR